MTEPTPKPSDWSALDLPVLTEVADETAVPTLGAEASLEMPEFTPPASSSKPSPVPDLKLELPPDLQLDELLEEESPPPLTATSEFALVNLPSLDLEQGEGQPLDELLPTLGPAAYVNADVPVKPASPAASEQDFEFDLNLEPPGAASVVEPETLPQPHSHAELEELTEEPEQWRHPPAPAASPEFAASHPAPVGSEHSPWDELPLSDNWDVAPPDMPASVQVGDAHQTEVEQFEAADQAQPVTVEPIVPAEAISPAAPTAVFGASPAAFTPAEPQPESESEAAQDFEFLLEPEAEPVASSEAILEQETAIPDFEFPPPHSAVLTEQEAEIAAEAMELSFESVTEPEAAIHVPPEPTTPPELTEPDFESMAEPELAAPLGSEFFASAEQPLSEASTAEQPAEADSARVSAPEPPTALVTAPGHEVSTEEALRPELAALAATEPSWPAEVVQEAESSDTVAAAEPLVPELTEPAATETDIPPAAASEIAATEQEKPEFAAVELSFESAVEPESAASVPHAPPPQSIEIDSLPRGVLNSPLTAQSDPMAALQERLAEIHANLDSVRQESSLRRDPSAEVAHSLTQPPVQSAKDAFAAAALASEEAFPPESFPDLASVAEPVQPAPDAHGKAVAVVGEDVLIESLYHRILPRMKVELGLWLQDALALQSKQLLSGVMQQLKEDYDQMFGETLRESLRQALADVARIEHKDKDQE